MIVNIFEVVMPFCKLTPSSPKKITNQLVQITARKNVWKKLGSYRIGYTDDNNKENNNYEQ